MLTTKDLQHIKTIVQQETRQIVQQETRQIVQQETRQIVREKTRNFLTAKDAQNLIITELKPIKKDIRKIKSDLKTTINFFDQDYLKLKFRDNRLETHCFGTT